MAGLGLNWQDFMRRPEIKVLLEERGMVAVKQRYQQEQNKLMWNDPQIINEAKSPGQSVNNNSSADGGATQFITGHTAQTARLRWADGITNSITGSDLNFGVTIHAYDGTTDFSQGHVDSDKKILLAFVSGSTLGDLGGLSSTGYDIVVTASSADIGAFPGGGINQLTGSWGTIMQDAVTSQTATAVVGGFTNTIAPSTLISATTMSNGESLLVTNVVKGTPKLPHTDIASTTASISIQVDGFDTYEYDKGKNHIFRGNVAPYTFIPRKY